MELFIIFTLFIVGYYFYQNSPVQQNKKKQETSELLLREADEAYEFLSQKLDTVLKKDLPRWVKEAEENFNNWKKDFPDKEPPNILTLQPKKQAARKRDFEKDISELNRIRDKFIRIMIRYEHSSNIDLKHQTIYDFHQWVVKKAKLLGFHGIEHVLYTSADEQEAWKIKFEEIERRFDDLLSK